MTKKTVYPPWVILHLPHDADRIPGEVRDQFILNDEDLARELLCMTDHRTAVLFGAVLASAVARAPVSRLVVDVERFEFDAEEPMAERGMGVVYSRTSAQAPLRRALAVAERERLLEAYYRPHHLRLTRLVNDALADHGKALVLDAHSFPSLPLPYERWKGRRPDICIGTDAFHTAAALRDVFVASFEKAGFDVAVDAPFAGALVPSRHYRADPRVQAVMVEVNRSLYLDEATGRPLSGFRGIADMVQRCCARALDDL